MQKFLDMISIQLQSKRTWATITSLLSVIGGVFFPQYLEGALAIAGILQSWALSDAVRPAVSKWLNKTQAEQPELSPEIKQIIEDVLAKR
jgi:hypothetical protein